MKELYVTGVVLANGIPDTHGDVFDKKDIKKIFIQYLNHDTDTMHSYIRNEGVDLIANWISEQPKTIGDKTAPTGSWLATFRVTNEEIISSLNDGNIQGLSLGSIPKEILTQKFWFLNQKMPNIKSFQDLDAVDDAKPVFISFVDNPSNQFGLEIDEMDMYINKNAVGDMKMPNEEIINETADETISLSGLEKIKDILGINKSVEAVEETPAVEVKPEPIEEKTTDDISNQELLEKIPNAVATGITSAFEKMAEAKKEEEEEEPVEPEQLDEPEKTEEEEVTAEPVKEVPKIDKRATVKTEPVSEPNTSTDFYAKSGRDAFGCRLK